MKKLIVIGIITLFVIVGFFMFSGTNSVSGIEVKQYKSPSCGCCVGHGGYLNSNGFNVETIADDATLSGLKDSYNIPMDMRSCHTEMIEGYFVEGHIPVEAINKMLEERPDIDGIAMPGMPSGSPGMPGTKRGEWIIYSIKDGQSSEFMRI